MKVFLTGATGLVGRELASAAVRAGAELFAAQHTGEAGAGTPVRLDLRSEDSVKKALASARPEVVIHSAAMTNVDECESDEALATAVNATATKVLAAETKKRGCHLVYVSTDYVFDGSKGRYREEDRPNPVNHYGRTKLMGEEAVRAFASSWCIARTSTPYGMHPKRKSFPVFVAERLAAGRQVLALAEQYTSPTYTVNLSDMILELAARRFQGTMHVSTPTRISRLDFAGLIAEELGLDRGLLGPATPEQLGWVARRPNDTSLDVSKATAYLKNRPERLDESLEVFLPSLRRHVFRREGGAKAKWSASAEGASPR